MDEKISHESGGVWSPDETRYWPADKDLTLDFYAQAPYGNAHVTDVSAGEGKISFSYTVPGGTGNTDAEAQPDILFAYAACSKAKSESDGGTVSLTFRHALAGVKFVASDVTGSTIKNITLTGLQGEGTCTYDAGTGTFDWQTDGDKCDFSQTFDVALSGQQAEERQPITDKRPETTFMMIPQTLEGVTVEVTLEETASGDSFTLDRDMGSRQDLHLCDFYRIHQLGIRVRSDSLHHAPPWHHRRAIYRDELPPAQGRPQHQGSRGMGSRKHGILGKRPRGRDVCKNDIG